MCRWKEEREKRKEKGKDPSAHEIPSFFREPHTWNQLTSLLHRQLVVADRLLEPQVLNFNVLCFAQALSAYYGQCRTGVDAQPHRHGSTRVFGRRLNSHRL